VPNFIGEGKVIVLGTEIVHRFGRNWPFAAVASVLLLALVLLPALLAALARGRSEEGSP